MSLAHSVAHALHVIFLEDVLLKLVCLVLAVLFWFYIDGELTDEREVAVTLAPAGLVLPGDLEVAARQRLPEFSVRIRGPRRRLQYLAARDIFMDLKDLLPKPVPGLQTVKVHRDLFHVEGMDVVGVQPPEFELELVRLSQRSLPVQPLISPPGKPRSGYRLVRAVAKPEYVRVKAREDLEQARVIVTEPVSVQDRAEDFQVLVGLAKTVQVGDREVAVDCPERVLVTLEVRRQEITRVFDAVPIEALAPPGATLTIQPPSVRVAVRGAPEDVAGLRKADLRLYVEWPPDWDLTRVQGETFPARPVQVRVITPAGIPSLLVQGEAEQPLPTVRIQGQLTRPAVGP